MKCRHLVLFGVLAAVVAMAWVPMAGQASRSAASTAASTYTPPRTAWGDPDLQGIWRSLERVPFERPAQYEGREFLTDAEVAEQEQKLNENNAAQGRGEQESTGFRNQANYNNIVNWSDERVRVSRRTSAIIDPPDGLLPPWTLEQVKRYEAREAATLGRGDADWTIDRPAGERCIAEFGVPYVNNWGMGIGGGLRTHEDPEVNLAIAHNPTAFRPGATLPKPKRFVQAPGYVATTQEERQTGGGASVYHVIPLDGRPHLEAKFEQYLGDPRGHWEGNTLVVETTNVKYFGPVLLSYGSSFHPSGTGDTLRVIERYTRVGPDTMEYTYTVDDPAVYTRPWTVAHNLVRDDLYKGEGGNPCKEGIDDLGTTLYGWRLDEDTAMAQAKDTRLARQAGFERMKQRAIEEAKRQGSKQSIR